MAEITNTWEEIIESISDGSYASKYCVGDYKPIDLMDAGVVNMQIAGFEVDDLSDGSGKAPITFVAQGLLSANHAMNSSKNSVGGWGKSELRTYLETVLLQLFPSVVKSNIVSVKKTHESHDENINLVTQETQDLLWIPSEGEVVNGKYSSLFPDDASRAKSSRWWIRDVYPSSGRFKTIETSGETDYWASTNSLGVCIGFCLNSIGSITENFYKISDKTLQSIGDAVRLVTGVKRKMTPTTMIDELEKLSSGGDEVFVVNVAGSNGTYTADKTFAEIKDAYNNNMNCVILYSLNSSEKAVIPLERMTASLAEFAGIVVDAFSPMALKCYIFRISDTYVKGTSGNVNVTS